VKILQIVPFFAPLHGGAAQVPYHLSRALAKRGHEVTLWTSDYKISSDWIKSAQESGVEVCYFKTWLNLAKLLITPGLIVGTRERVKGFDIIHMHGYRTFQDIVVQRYASKYDVPYVLQAHGTLLRIMTKQRLKLAYDVVFGYRLLDKAARLIALNEMEADEYKSMKVSDRKIVILPNGIDDSEFKTLPERGKFRGKHGLDNSQKLILYLGRINAIKGLELLTRAFTELSMSLSDLKLVIVGPDDGYLSSLKALITELRIGDKVLLTGPLWGEDKLQAYIDSDVYVLPSLYDWFPLTVLEALACGLPVIVSDRCGIASAINGKTGLSFRYDDKEQLKRALAQMLSDEKMRHEFGDRGKALVRDQFTWERVAAEFEAIYEKVRIKSKN